MTAAVNTSGTGITYPFPEIPPPGTLTDVAPGVKWLRMPLPFALNHINLWVLDDGDGWTIVDTGINSTQTRDIWTRIFAGPLKAKPVKRLICTHFHPDHMGLAGWLVEVLKIPLWVTAKEWAAARRKRGQKLEETVPMMTEEYTRAGLKDALSDAITNRGNEYAKRVHELPETMTLIDPAKTIISGGHTWNVVVGEGHSPQLAALHAPKPGILISGDQVLPGISPNVSVRHSDGDVAVNPLKNFMESLVRFRELPADTLVLPSHKLPFYGLRPRIDELIAHHHDRLDLTRTACAKGATARQVLEAMFQREFDVHQLHFALGETLAHLHYLLATGEIVRESTPEGVDRYRTVASPAAAA